MSEGDRGPAGEDQRYCVSQPWWSCYTTGNAVLSVGHLAPGVCGAQGTVCALGAASTGSSIFQTAPRTPQTRAVDGALPHLEGGDVSPALAPCSFSLSADQGDLWQRFPPPGPVHTWGSQRP